MVALTDFMILLKKRKSCYEFLSTPVSKGDLEKILEAGRWSPSPFNLQPWKFKVIRDSGKIAQLIKASYYGAFHTPPVLVIAVVVDNSVVETLAEVIRDKGLGEQSAFLALGMAAYSMVLEAEQLGISSCFLTPKPDRAKRIVGVQKNVGVPLLVGLGYEVKDAFQKKRFRKPLDEVLL